MQRRQGAWGSGVLVTNFATVGVPVTVVQDRRRSRQFQGLGMIGCDDPFRCQTTPGAGPEDEGGVAEAIRLIERDGWRQIAQRGSHRQFKHKDKLGRVTVAGKPSDELAPGTLNSILKQAGLKGGA